MEGRRVTNFLSGGSYGHKFVSQNLDFGWPPELYEFLLTFSYESASFWPIVGGGTTSEGLAGYFIFLLVGRRVTNSPSGGS